MLINKEHKLKAILDIKKGRITNEVAKHLKQDRILLSERELLINGIEYDRATFDEIHNYFKDVLQIKSLIYVAFDNAREFMLNYDKIIK